VTCIYDISRMTVCMIKNATDRPRLILSPTSCALFTGRRVWVNSYKKSICILNIDQYECKYCMRHQREPSCDHLINQNLVIASRYIKKAESTSLNPAYWDNRHVVTQCPDYFLSFSDLYFRFIFKIRNDTYCRFSSGVS
jgi:hypothetical protein